MSEPFIGEIRMMSFGFAPRGWAFCNGQQLPINQNQALFSLLGTTYGGNGVTTFALPNLQGRTPLHFGSGAGLSPVTLGQVGGEEGHTLTQNEMPGHTHQVQASSQPGNTRTPGNGVWAATGSGTNYSNATPNVQMQASQISPTGGSQPHENRQPYLTINFCIAIVGIFPSRN